MPNYIVTRYHKRVPRRAFLRVLFANELPFRQTSFDDCDITTDLRVLVIATTSVIVATAGGVSLLQLIGRHRSLHLPTKAASRVLLQTTSGPPSKSMMMSSGWGISSGPVAPLRAR